MKRYDQESIWIQAYVEVLYENKHRYMNLNEIWHASNAKVNRPMAFGWLKRMLKEWAASGELDCGVEKVGGNVGVQFYRLT